MKRFFKQNAKMLLIVLAVVVLFPILILTPSRWGFIPREVGIAIVGYGGSIIGGFLTLYGVWWTIDDNQAGKRKNLELQYCPVLSAEIVRPNKPIRSLCSEVLIMHNHYGFDDANPMYTPEVIKLTNVGRGEIKHTSFHLAKCEIIATNPAILSKEICMENSYILCDNACNFVPIGGEFILQVGVPAINRDFFASLNQNYYARMSVTLEISVQGVFTFRDQQYELTFYIDTGASTYERSYNLSDISLVMP